MILMDMSENVEERTERRNMRGKGWTPGWTVEQGFVEDALRWTMCKSEERYIR